MKIKWTERARDQKNDVADYIRRQFGVKRRIRFLQEVRETTMMLRNTPTIGKIDPLYAERPIAYRSVIINGLNKMVYRIDGDIIYIVDFWDTRREPRSQASQTK
jgi:plasmid stabilization system protein ParE